MLPWVRGGQGRRHLRSRGQRVGRRTQTRAVATGGSPAGKESQEYVPQLPLLPPLALCWFIPLPKPNLKPKRSDSMGVTFPAQSGGLGVGVGGWGTKRKHAAQGPGGGQGGWGMRGLSRGDRARPVSWRVSGLWEDREGGPFRLESRVKADA